MPDSCHLTYEAFDDYFSGRMNEALMAVVTDLAVYSPRQYYSARVLYKKINPA